MQYVAVVYSVVWIPHIQSHGIFWWVRLWSAVKRRRAAACVRAVLSGSGDRTGLSISLPRPRRQLFVLTTQEYMYVYSTVEE